MSKIIYLHGFGSAGSTGTATELRNHFYPLGVEVLSPDIPVYPKDAVPFLQQYIKKQLGEPTGAGEPQQNIIVATSMGAMYAELMKGYARVLVNPSFQMSRSLTFMHLNKNVEFRNPRKDGAKQFKVDKEMVAQFKAIETPCKKGEAKSPRVLQDITAEEKQLVWGIFGTRDKFVNFQKEFQKAYGCGKAVTRGTANDHFQLFDGEHFLNSEVLKKEVLPLLHEILGIE